MTRKFVAPAQAGAQVRTAGESATVNWIPASAGMTNPFPIASASVPALGRIRHILSTIALPKPEQDTWVAPDISRAKS